MAKKLSAKIGEYQKDGQTKGRYVNIGVVMQSNDGGEYILLDPTVSLAGVMGQQNAMAMQKGEQVRDRIMVSVFEEQQNAQQYNQAPQQNYQQAPQQRQQNQPMTPQEYQNYQNQIQQAQQFDDELPPF